MKWQMCSCRRHEHQEQASERLQACHWLRWKIKYIFDRVIYVNASPWRRPAFHDQRSFDWSLLARLLLQISIDHLSIVLLCKNSIFFLTRQRKETTFRLRKFDNDRPRTRVIKIFYPKMMFQPGENISGNLTIWSIFLASDRNDSRFTVDNEGEEAPMARSRDTPPWVPVLFQVILLPTLQQVGSFMGEGKACVNCGRQLFSM